MSVHIKMFAKPFRGEENQVQDSDLCRTVEKSQIEINNQSDSLEIRA